MFSSSACVRVRARACVRVWECVGGWVAGFGFTPNVALRKPSCLVKFFFLILRITFFAAFLLWDHLCLTDVCTGFQKLFIEHVFSSCEQGKKCIRHSRSWYNIVVKVCTCDFDHMTHCTRYYVPVHTLTLSSRTILLMQFNIKIIIQRNCTVDVQM